MQRSNIIIAVVVLFAAGAAISIWFLSRPGAPDNTPREIVEQPFPADDFFLAFDLDKNGSISAEEFTEAYARAEDRFRFNEGPGKPALDAKGSFAKLDVNHDGKIDREDLTAAFDKAWLKFKQDSAVKGLEARLWHKKWLTFNPHQVQALNKEMGAEARSEMPFGGAFFAKKYFKERRYVTVTEVNGDIISGFAWEDRANNRLHVLCEDATIRVFEPAKVTITERAGAPQIEFINTVEKTSFEDSAANLKLARRCKELGLKTEAGMMYSRVLIFEPDNAEALDALGFKKDGPMFVPKGG